MMGNDQAPTSEIAKIDPAPTRLRARSVRAVGAGIALVCMLYAGDRAWHAGRVARGVWMSGATLGGSSRADVERIVGDLQTRLAKAPLRVRVGDEIFEVAPSSLGFSLDVAASVQLALSRGRQGVFTDFGFWLGRFVSPDRVRAVARLDLEETRAAIDAWERKALVRPFGGGVVSSGEGLAASPPRRGSIIDREAALGLIRTALTEQPRTTLALPVMEVDPFVVPGALSKALEEARRLTAHEVVLSSDDDITLRLAPRDLRSALESREPTAQNPKSSYFSTPLASSTRSRSCVRKSRRRPRTPRSLSTPAIG